MQRQEAGGADQVIGKQEEEEELVFAAAWDCGSPLYDSFELASLHHVLENHLMVLPFPGPVSQQPERCGVAAPDETTDDRRARAAKRKARRVWKGSKAAAKVFVRALTCWKSL
ncbi:hypothetical protein ACP70R_037085 [Stipagrostis hirtigluma subsp. patula]